MAEECVKYGAVISLLVSLLARIPFVHNNTRLVVAGLTFLASVFMDTAVSGFNLSEFLTCWAQVLGAALVTNTFVTQPLAEKVQ